MALLCGIGSPESLTRFNRKLQSQAVADTQKALGIHFDHFELWMCHENERVNLQSMHDLNSGKELEIVRGVKLSRMARSFGLDGAPLARLDRKAISFAVGSPNSIEIESLLVLLEEVENFNESYCPQFNNKIRSVVKQVVPIVAQDPELHPTRENGSGFSNHHLRGMVFLSLPRAHGASFIELALNLAHEVGHQALMVYQCGDEILADDLSQPVYSIIRRTSRPAILSFHAVVATAFMLEWLMEAAPYLIISREYLHKRWRGLVKDLEAAISVFNGIKFTSFGLIIFNEIRLLARNVSDFELDRAWE